MTHVLLKVAFLCSALCVYHVVSADRQTAQEVTILYTNNTNGELKHCGCPGNPMGSLAQRFTEIERIRALKKAVLLLDGGDIFPPRIDDDLKLTYVLRIFESLHYDAVGLGDQDFGKGIGELELLAKGRLPYLAANVVRVDTQKPLVPGTLRKTINGIDCLVIGVVAESAYVWMASESRDQIKVLDPIERIRAILSVERRPNDVIIILSHMGFEEDRKLAKAIPGIHVIVGGHSQNLLQEPVREGETLIVQDGKFSQYLGMLTIRMERGKVVNFQNRMIPLDDRVSSHPRIEAMAREFYSTNEQIVVLSGDSAKPYEAGRCRNCHASAFRVWSKSGHARALDGILKDDRARTKECLFCHTTTVQSSLSQTLRAPKPKVVANVQCLACHQITFPKDETMHQMPAPKMTSLYPSINDLCLKCHNMKESPDFEFEKYWKKFQHGKE